MMKAYEYRIYPTSQQEEIFNQTLGLCRLYWNIVVFNKNQDHNFQIEGYKQIFTKYKPDALKWSKDAACSIPLAQMWSDIRAAYTNFFKSCKGVRKGKFSKPPKFKSKKNPKDSFRYSCSNCTPKIDRNGLYLTKKLGYIKISAHCRFAEGKWKNITFRRTATGKWFVKICVEKKDEPKNNNGKAIGIDWNCRDEDFLVMSNGTKFKCPRFLQRSQKQLSHQQKIMSKRFVKGLETQSSNYYKQKQKVALLHEKVANQRKDWLHKLSRQICNEYETVVVEDINVQTMSRMNHGKVVGDQGFGMLRQMIAYKGNLVKVNPKNTSKTCHICGFINPKVKVGINYWKCPVCSTEHDRDINAALNILSKYVTSRSIVGWELTENTNACGVPRSTAKQENELTSSV
ncbi:MAG TPA: transposase [Candidatus Pacearchaeota archaeon]|nr:transposase [Candidatus Pacearchaeota archaeon]